MGCIHCVGCADSTNNSNKMETDLYRQLEKLKTGVLDKDFSFNGYEGWAKVVSVLDGDTLRIQIIYHNNIIQLRIRCCGYNSPELKPSLKHENRQLEINNANRSLNRIIELTTNCPVNMDSVYTKYDIKEMLLSNSKLIYVKLYDFDNFGRV